VINVRLLFSDSVSDDHVLWAIEGRNGFRNFSGRNVLCLRNGGFEP
jgi:hypothetical protein